MKWATLETVGVDRMGSAWLIKRHVDAQAEFLFVPSGKRLPDNATIPIAGEPDAIWYNRSRHKLYVAIGKHGVVDVLDTKTMLLDEEIVTEEGAHTTAFDPTRQKLYVFLPRSCRAAIYVEG